MVHPPELAELRSPADRRLVEGFLDRTLPEKEWTHEAHLRVALWHLLRYSPAEALTRLRDGIRSYNESIGGANTATSGYHESITRLYVALLEDFVRCRDDSESFEELIGDALATFRDRKLPLRYYSRARLDSVEARLGWIEPDVQPLPGIDGVVPPPDSG